jgi:hypothetical protein
MEDPQATYCFCGCGTRVKNPRTVATNLTGWDLNRELAEWTKIEFLWDAAELEPSPQLEKNIADGHELWLVLANSIHDGVKPEKEDELRAGAWSRHAKKERKKLRKHMRRGGGSDPFELPDLDVQELNAWITRGERPSWAGEGREEEEHEEGPTIGEALVMAAYERSSDDWMWTDDTGPPIIETADQLSQYPEDYNLVLDAIALGYWIRDSEPDVIQDQLIPDKEYSDQLRDIFEKEGSEAIRIGMGQTAIDMPAAFVLGEEAWADVIRASSEALAARARLILRENEELDSDFPDLGDDLRSMAIGIGYGCRLVVGVLGVEGTHTP